MPTITKGNLIPATSKLTRSSRTVLLRMAADQERADRIRLLKQENPQLKWRHIADHVGVELRSAQMWQESGAISYDNAKKLAQLVDDPERSVDWIMRGPRKTAPSPFAGQDDLADRLDRAEQRVTDQLAEHARKVERLLAEQDQLLERQSRILERIEAAIDRQDLVRDEISQAIDRARSIAGPPPAATELDPSPVPEPRVAAKKPRAAAQRTR